MKSLLSVVHDSFLGYVSRVRDNRTKGTKTIEYKGRVLARNPLHSFASGERGVVLFKWNLGHMEMSFYWIIMSIFTTSVFNHTTTTNKRF